MKKEDLDIYRRDCVKALTQQRSDVVLSSIFPNSSKKDGAPDLTSSNHLTNGIVLSSIDCRVGHQSINYDRELIRGGLLWLSHVLTAQPGDVVTIPACGVLRAEGRLAGAPPDAAS